ncbi:FAD-binding oxidoreductase [Ktedonobacter robiniae]|uniref:FAD-binding dehydrogenase n=1 Tax=Ktedonobacter robiniae TaxID=2778365 RepID=A0ABQ3UTY9_9CHLR|nr:FAD-binding oxidoreductase [Ktedonobacter robiniae]GHO56233.1 FAD-binding dehydrogenase [Ktedonobacter robiniae]
MNQSSLHLDDLRSKIDGLVIEPGSFEYTALPKLNNARFDHIQPQGVVLCSTPADVTQTVGFIRSLRLETATRCGGHCFAGRSSTPGLLIDVSAINSVSLSNGTARIGAGARLGEVYSMLLANGMTIPGGSCPSVGIAGLTLGGGLGWLGRKYGLTSDHLIGAKIVVADGRILSCDEGHHQDLFWALRGAGTGHFGVVVELLFQTLPAPQVATIFRLTWPFSHAARVVDAWLGWAGGAPSEMAASLDLRASEDPTEPPSCELFGMNLGTRSDTLELLEAFTARLSTSPTSTLVEEMTYQQTLRHWADRAGERLEVPRAPNTKRRYEAIKSEFFAQPLPPEAVVALVDNLTRERVPGSFRELNFSAWGGAYNRVPADATAFAHRDGRYWLKHTAAVEVSAEAHEKLAAERWANRSWQTVRGWGTGHVFPNFPDPNLADWGHAYYGANYERLLEVKYLYDRHNVFHFHQSLPTTR